LPASRRLEVKATASRTPSLDLTCARRPTFYHDIIESALQSVVAIYAREETQTTKMYGTVRTLMGRVYVREANDAVDGGLISGRQLTHAQCVLRPDSGGLYAYYLTWHRHHDEWVMKWTRCDVM